MINKNKKFNVREIKVSYNLTDIQLPDNKANCAADVIEIFKDLQDSDKEKFCCLHLTIRNKVIGFEIITIGSQTESIVNIKDIFKAALIHNAVNIIIVHNHPSGEPNPSGEDMQVTKKIQAAAKLLEINVLDHIIIGENCYYSFLEKGLLK